MKLYKLDASPPARATMMLCDILGLKPEMVDVNLMEKEHLKPEYTKLNPVHTIPVLEDGDVVLHDSHAILMYLQDVYGKSESLYPKDVKKRAYVNQKLFFNNSVLFPRIRNITINFFLEGKLAPTERQLYEIDEAYSFLEQFLSRTKYLAGDNMTIADIAAISTVSSLVHLQPLDAKKYPKTQAWINELEKQSYYQTWNKPGNDKFGGFIDAYRNK